MVQCQARIELNNENCEIAFDVLAREDANDAERALAKMLQDTFTEMSKRAAALAGVDLKLTIIGPEDGKASP